MPILLDRLLASGDPESQTIRRRTAKMLTGIYAASKAAMLARHTAQWQSVKRHADRTTDLGMTMAERGRSGGRGKSASDEMDIRVGDEIHSTSAASLLTAGIIGAALAAAGLPGYRAPRPLDSATRDPVPAAATALDPPVGIEFLQ